MQEYNLYPNLNEQIVKDIDLFEVYLKNYINDKGIDNITNLLRINNKHHSLNFVKYLFDKGYRFDPNNFAYSIVYEESIKLYIENYLEKDTDKQSFFNIINRIKLFIPLIKDESVFTLFKLGYKITNDTPKQFFIERDTLFFEEIIMKYNQNIDIVNLYTGKERFTENFIDYLLKHNYDITRNSCDTLKSDIKLFRKAIMNYNYDINIINLYTGHNYFNIEFIDYLLEHGYFYDYDTCSALMENEYFFKQSIMKYNDDVSVINYYSGKIISDKSFIDYLLKNNYKFVDYSCEALKLDEYFFEQAIMHYNYDVNIIDSYTGPAIFAEEFITYLFSNGYKITNNSCEALRYDENFFIQGIMKYNQDVNLIDYYLFEVICDNNFIDYILSNGYKFSDTSCQALKNDSYIFEMAIMKYNYNVNIIDYYNRDSSFLSDEFVKYILDNGYDFNSDILLEYDKELFKEYYEKNYKCKEVDKLLALIDYNYQYLIYFLKKVVNIQLTFNSFEDERKLYSDYLLNINLETFASIIKYVFYSGDESQNKFIEIVKDCKYSELINIYNLLFDDWYINKFKQLVNNFMDNEVLCRNVLLFASQHKLTNELKIELIRILINGDVNAKGKINDVRELSNYNEIIYNFNKKKIHTATLKQLKDIIFMNLFNMNYLKVLKLLDTYKNSNGFNNLINSIHNETLKDILREYDCVIKFINSIYNATDIATLKALAIKINEQYKSKYASQLNEIWQCFSRLEKDIRNICGIEINEKIIKFDELLNTPIDRIPKNSDGSLSFIISDKKVEEDFYYDNKLIQKGKNVKYIELNGIPFVSLGHALNAFGKDGKVSDFNHVRMMGRVHLCLSAIDDLFYNLASPTDEGIDHVYLLFDTLPSERFAIASEKDIGSHSNENILNIDSWNEGNFNSVRINIINTIISNQEYNEYVYYRDDIKPGAILIRGDEPSKYELQAAAYLDVPLVKINKERYPKMSATEMQKKELELKSYYDNLYAERTSLNMAIDLNKLQELKNMLLSLYGNMEKVRKKVR